MKVRVEQIDKLSTTKGTRVMLILEVVTDKEIVDTMKTNEYYDVEFAKILGSIPPEWGK